MTNSYTGAKEQIIHRDFVIDNKIYILRYASDSSAIFHPHGRIDLPKYSLDEFFKLNQKELVNLAKKLLLLV